MDADNRVILNCGGIRHEVYKVIIMFGFSFVCQMPIKATEFCYKDIFVRTVISFELRQNVLSRV